MNGAVHAKIAALILDPAEHAEVVGVNVDDDLDGEAAEFLEGVET